MGLYPVTDRIIPELPESNGTPDDPGLPKTPYPDQNPTGRIMALFTSIFPIWLFLSLFGKPTGIHARKPARLELFGLRNSQPINHGY